MLLVLVPRHQSSWILQVKKVLCTGSIEHRKSSWYLNARSSSPLHQLPPQVHQRILERSRSGLVQGKSLLLAGLLMHLVGRRMSNLWICRFLGTGFVVHCKSIWYLPGGSSASLHQLPPQAHQQMLERLRSGLVQGKSLLFSAALFALVFFCRLYMARFYLERMMDETNIRDKSCIQRIGFRRDFRFP